MSNSYPLPDELIDGLSKLARVPSDDLLALSRSFHEIPPFLQFSDLAKAVSTDLKSDTSQIAALIGSVLVPLVRVRIENDATAEELILELLTILSSNAPPLWTKEDLEAIEKALPLIKPLIDTNTPLWYVSQAYEALSGRAPFYRSAAIITSQHPLLNESKTSVGAYVQSAMLAITYFDGNGEKIFYLGVDDRDLRDLTEEIENAATALRVGRDALKNAAIPVIAYSSSTTEDN